MIEEIKTRRSIRRFKIENWKMLLSQHPNNDVLYYDHPYECGIVAFERK